MGTETSNASYTFETNGKAAATFLVGALIGAGIAHIFTKRYYAKKADEAVADVVERFSKTTDNMVAELDTATAILADATEDLRVGLAKETQTTENDPYVISVSEYTDDDDYDKETLIFYDGNQVLSDQYDHELDISALFGIHWPFLATHVGEDEEDILYVRNPKLKTDYEICWEHKSAPEYVMKEGDEDD